MQNVSKAFFSRYQKVQNMTLRARYHNEYLRPPQKMCIWLIFDEAVAISLMSIVYVSSKWASKCFLFCLW